MDETDAREILGMILGAELQPGHRTGMAIGSMTTDEATKCAEVARKVSSGEPLIIEAA